VLKEKQPHDMADVLLSLKHAVVHPGQAAGQLSPCGNFTGSYNAGQQCSGQGSYQGPSASLSYTVHPHQVRCCEDERGHNSTNKQKTLAKQLPYYRPKYSSVTLLSRVSKRRWDSNIKMDLREIWLIWLRIGASGGLL
jgi:hypothetical protein